MREFERLARELEARIDQLAISSLDRLRERVPAWVLETAISRNQIEEFARESLQAQLRAFRRNALPKTGSEVDAAASRTVAKVGGLEVLLNGYRVAQMTLWEAWFSLVEDSPEIEPGERRALLARGSDFFFRYADLLGDYVAETAQREIEQLRGNSEQRRFRAIRGLLEGEPLSASAPRIDLDLDLNQHHLGLIAWGDGGDIAARQLAAAFGRPLVLVSPLEGSWWGWISGSRPFERNEERIINRFQPPSGSGIALGLPAYGEPGFRATHRQSQRARWLATPMDSPLVRYADLAVESLATENEEDARTFVERELGGIGDDSATAKRLRETLVAYFAAEHNAASAAATLGVHQQTVANRLRSAEERLGHPIGARRVELEVALRLRAALDRSESS